MDLREFISKTASDIVKGLDDASIGLKNKSKSVGLYSAGKSNQRHIEFDVAVVASNKDKSNKGGNGEIKVWGTLQVGAKIEKTFEASNSTVSRIKFGIRIKDIKKE